MLPIILSCFNTSQTRRVAGPKSGTPLKIRLLILSQIVAGQRPQGPSPERVATAAGRGPVQTSNKLLVCTSGQDIPF